jgi:tRNA pseudouridine38-40 synthase
MRNIKLIISYDGGRYFGWQKTKSGPSIEEALETALLQILQEKVSLQAASRTDRGVHATGQVVNFILTKEDLDLKKLQHGLNGLLNEDISVLSIEEVEASFHPTLDNEGKEYHYSVCNTPYQLPFHREYSWHFPYPLDLELMQKAARLLEGYRDFSAFCNDKAHFTRDPLCRIDKIEVRSLKGGRICLCVRGTRFLYKMVRNIVGTLTFIASGKIPFSALEGILEGKQRSQAGVTAPAHGLVLKQIFYPAIKESKEELVGTSR